MSSIIPRKASKRTDMAILIALFSVALVSQYVYYDLGYLSMHLWSIAQYMVTFYLGVTFSKYNLFDRVSPILGFIPTLLMFILLIIAMVMRSYTPIIAINNTLYAPLIVLATTIIISRNVMVRRFLLFFGAISTELWLCHSFFIYYGFYKIAYISTNPWFVLLWVIILSVATALILKSTYKMTQFCVSKANTIYRLCLNR